MPKTRPVPAQKAATKKAPKQVAKPARKAPAKKAVAKKAVPKAPVKKTAPAKAVKITKTTPLKVVEQICKSRVSQQKVVKPRDLVSLEAIDMSASEEEIIAQLMNNLTKVGFLTLKNIEGYDEAEHFRAVYAFYNDVPQEERARMIWRHHRPENTNYYRGVAPFVDNDKAHKEMYDMGGKLSDVSDEALKHPLYEESPFPPQ